MKFGRYSPGFFAVAIVILVLAIATGLTKINNAVVAGIAGALAAIFSLLATILLAPTVERRKKRAEILSELHKGFRLARNGDLPKVRSVDNAVMLGVHKATPSRRGDGALPPYVPRDVDTELEAAFQASILIKGDSASGKTRTAYEFIRRTYPDWRIAAPVDGTALRWIYTHGPRLDNTVLWLDDLERYIRNDGLDQVMLEDLLVGGRGRVVLVATIRLVEYDRIVNGVPVGRPDGEQRHILHSARGVLENPDLIKLSLERKLSESEQDRAMQMPADDRILAALKEFPNMGLAEYLASGPQLVERWLLGRSLDNQPLGAAMVSAAVDLARVGWYKPLQSEDLRKLAELYTDIRIVALAADTAFDDALRWATAPVNATTALLEPTGQGVKAPDYLVDYAQRSTHMRPPRQLFSYLLDRVDSSAALVVGLAAYDLADPAMALRFHLIATRNLDHPDFGFAAANIGTLYYEGRNWRNARRWWRRAAEAGDPLGAMELARVTGDSDPHLSHILLGKAAAGGIGTAASALGDALRRKGNRVSAGVVLRRAASEGHVPSMCILGGVYAELGRIPKARHMWVRAMDAGSVLARINIATLDAMAGDIPAAVAAWEQLEKTPYFSIACRCQGVAALLDGRLAEARSYFERANVVTDWQSSVLLAYTLSCAGDPTEAVTWLRISRRVGMASARHGQEYLRKVLTGDWLAAAGGWQG
ncbi:hypothetical protein OU415_16805 [Saccharopolyspora sp. WRP15-2]|uniref:Sel1 repeat family protein n=1 Tax=Saccharopolyspora oryzae TaxID=2997343 RepID=A0ABT4V1A9_9PSEU|nr:hypothetical protein [Saccharopolyspora oryzae]MDA3627107.1 hypothetical protein [Saccharopolyspora oryzae]